MPGSISRAVAALCLGLLACGGGGGEGPKTVALTGTVAGTTVVAYNETGARTSAVATGSTVPKSFSLTLATGHTYALYLVENEGSTSQRVYPLYADASTTINLLKLTEPGTIDLGFVDTSSGNAIPSRNPLFANGVSSGGTSTSIPTGLSTTSIVFSQADLAGRWALQGMMATASNVAWVRAVLDVAPNGVASFLGLESSAPITLPGTVQLTLTPGGVLHLANSDFLGAMAGSKDLVVWTATLPGGTALGVLLKQSTGRTGTELMGSFHFHRLEGTGGFASTLGTGSWARGEMAIDAGLHLALVPATFQTSDPVHDTTAGLTGVAAISGDGTVTLDGDPSFRGTLSSDGNTLVATGDSSGEHALLILQRKSSGFLTSALEGTWSLRELEFQPGGFSIWSAGKASVSAGFATLLELTPVFESSDPIPVAVSTEGVITLTGDSAFQGTLSPDGNLLVGTTSVDSGATTQMVVLVK